MTNVSSWRSTGTFEGNFVFAEGSGIYVADKVGIDLGWSVRDSTFELNLPFGVAVVWHGVDGASKAWSNEEATRAQLPRPSIKCNP